MVLDVPAFPAFRYIHTICSGLAVQDMMDGLRLTLRGGCGNPDILDRNAGGPPAWLDQSALRPSPSFLSFLFSKVSKGLWIPIRAFEVICRYTSVECGLRCPNNCWINVWLSPSSSAWQAKQWRRVCGVTPSGSPRLLACFLMNNSTAPFVRGASLTVLGNSHPIGRL